MRKQKPMPRLNERFISQLEVKGEIHTVSSRFPGCNYICKDGNLIFCAGKCGAFSVVYENLAPLAEELLEMKEHVEYLRAAKVRGI